MSFDATFFTGKQVLLQRSPKNGFVYRDEYNETRDSATLVIRSKGGHLDIEPFDFVTITGDVRGNAIEPKTLLVDGFSEEQTSFGDQEDYDVTYTFFSQTKELERVTCPNLSISALADGTRRKVLYYIEKYLSTYAPKVKVRSGNTFIYQDCWMISLRVRTRFQNVDCPEFSWNKPTLNEVITDLMMVDDCIPVIKNNTLDYIDLKKKKSEIDHSKIVSAKRQMASQDYNQNLVMNMQNAIGNRPSRMVEYISFRNETDGLLTTQNLQIVTQKPIYGVTRVVAMFRDKYYNGDTRKNEYRLTHIDLTQSIKEKSEYDVLDPTRVSVDAQGFLNIVPTHQLANVYYKRGGRTIEGWSREWDMGLGVTNISIQYLLSRWLEIQYGHYFDNHTMDDLDIRDVLFLVEYETLGEATMNVGRNLPLRNPMTSVFDNQGSSYVDINQQSIFEYAKANRLANKIIELNGVYQSEADVPQLGQTYNGAVIFSREIQYFDQSILFHAYATENYVLLNYFVAIRAKRRSWAIASGNEALTRHENIKFYSEFSFSKKQDVIASSEFSFDSANFAKEIISPLYRRYNDESVKICAFRSVDAANVAYPPAEGNGNAYFIVDCSVEISGMSMAFVVQFSDNYSAGIQMKISDSRRINQILPYADKYGEFREFSVAFLNYYDPADGAFTWPEYYVDQSGTLHGGGYVPFLDTTVWSSMAAKGRKKPVSTSISTSERSFELGKQIWKDNREVFALTAQIEFCSDTPAIIVNRHFVDSQKYITGATEDIYSLRMIAGTVASILNLPTAAKKYKNVGYIVRNLNQVAYSVESNGAYEWAMSAIGSSEKFTLLSGYNDYTNSSDADLAGYASRAKVVRYDPTIYSLVGEQLSYMLFLVDRKIKETDENVSDFAGHSIYGPSNMDLVITSGQFWAKIKVDSGIYDLYHDSTKAWVVTDQAGKILFAVNVEDSPYAGEASYQVYVNFLKTRDYRIYQSVANRQRMVGSIDDQ
jgi:hypothetical protein